MHLADLVFRERLANMQVTFFQVLDVHLLAFLNEGIDNIHLTSLLYLLPDKGIKGGTAVIELMNGLNRFASGRKLVDDRDIQIAIQGHG